MIQVRVNGALPGESELHPSINVTLQILSVTTVDDHGRERDPQCFRAPSLKEYFPEAAGFLRTVEKPCQDGCSGPLNACDEEFCLLTFHIVGSRDGVACA